MTYKEASRDVVIPGGHVYDIGFYDGDERQFVAFGSRDLEQLWNDFCDKNNLEKKTQICLNRGRQKTDTIFLNIPYRPCITGLMRKNMGRNTS